MPCNILNVLCAEMEGYFHDKDDSVRAGRYATILAGLILACYVFRWSFKLYGLVPALFSLFLFSFDPNIIAHTRLVTTDMYAALMITVSLYYFWRFYKHGGWINGLVSALVLGISQATKYTCLAFYPMLFFIGSAKYLWLCYEFKIKKDYRSIRVLTLKFIAYGGMFIAAAVLMINLSLGFAKTGVPLRNYQFHGEFCRSLQSINFLGELPLPLPYVYLIGLDMMETANAKAVSYGNIYLLGHLKDKSNGDIKGFKGYFFFAYLFKTPLASQLIILLAMFHYCRSRRSNRFMRDEIFLILPVLCFSIYMNFFFNIQIGMRYFIFCYPLLYVFAGSLFVNWNQFKVPLKAVFMSLLIYLAVSTLSYFPHYISYFNELVWDRKMAYKILADSNIDWGGNEWYLKEYLERYPQSLVFPSSIVPGRIIVSVNDLTGVVGGPQRYRWLRENFKPIDQIAYSYLVFNVSEEDLKKKGLLKRE